MKKYKIIYADPPWNGLGWNNGSGLKCPANHYMVQDLSWIKSLDVKSISDDTSALFLWATFPNLPQAIEVISEWGFNYATVAFTWVKRNKKADSFFVGCGNYTRANAEICLLGTKGHCQNMRVSRSVRQVCDARIERHSKKPEEIRERIIELFGDVPRLEMFCRGSAEGWDVFGNEAENSIEIPIKSAVKYNTQPPLTGSPSSDGSPKLQQAATSVS